MREVYFVKMRCGTWTESASLQTAEKMGEVFVRRSGALVPLRFVEVPFSVLDRPALSHGGWAKLWNSTQAYAKSVCRRK